MELVLVGVSHKTCPVETRESFGINGERKRRLLRDLLSGRIAAEELVWMSTCNRVDIYAVGKNSGCGQALCGIFGGKPGTESAYIYRKTGKDALNQLLKVACGLDSMVVGECEILGQIKNSYYDAKSAGITGRMTNMLFQRAIGVGKLVRTRTKISRGGCSVASVAVQCAGRIFGDLGHARVLLIGAGAMAEAAASGFAGKNAGLTVINRTYCKARELAKTFSAQCVVWEKLEEALGLADVVLASTASPEPVITRDLMRKIMAFRHGNPVFLADISVPRNIQPEAGGLANVHLYNIDDLERIVAGNLTSLSSEIKKAQEIIDAKSEEIWAKFSSDASVEPGSLKNPVVIGTRGSRLALAQAEIVGRLIKNEGFETENKIIKTSGDLFPEEPAEKLAAGAGKGVFVKEIERELLGGGIKLAVHSLKDLPGELAEGLTIAAYLEREDPRDALVSRSGQKLLDLPAGSKIATGSLRRRAQLSAMRPDLEFVPMRGNIDTRIARLKRGDCDALVVAFAALRRLGLEKSAAQVFSVGEVVPAPGQGVIAVEARESDLPILKLARLLDHSRTRICAQCERLFIKTLGGGCAAPFGAYARITEEGLLFRIFWADGDGKKRLNLETFIDCSRMNESVARLVQKIKA